MSWLIQTCAFLAAFIIGCAAFIVWGLGQEIETIPSVHIEEGAPRKAVTLWDVARKKGGPYFD